MFYIYPIKQSNDFMSNCNSMIKIKFTLKITLQLIILNYRIYIWKFELALKNKFEKKLF